MRMHRLLLASLVIALCAASAAQAYPSRPITMIVPFVAGGQTDVITRIVADHMRATLGAPIIIENVAGAGGTIGIGRVARAAPDGYTLTLGSQTQFVNSGAVYALSFDIVGDFEPVALVATGPYLILAKRAVPAKDLKELIAWIKANHNKVSQGHIGAGSGPHLCGIDMQDKIGARWTFVPYRGGAPATQDLLGGQIDLFCPASGTVLPMVRDGLLKAYAITGKNRQPTALDIPTVDEAGLPGLHVLSWSALWAPKGTPKAIVDKLNTAVRAALADQAVAARLADLGLDVPSRAEQTPEALRALQKAEIEKWWPIIRAAGIKPE
jgi:tripartite-type tricarboxylate transporter receptor subunit TctC